jgi:hypothetical protein
LIKDKPSGDGAKKNNAQKNSNPLAPVEDNPAAADRNRQPRQANSQREEKINRLLAADDAHREIVKGEVEGVRSQVSVGRIVQILGGCQRNRDIAITYVAK